MNYEFTAKNLHLGNQILTNRGVEWKLRKVELTDLNQLVKDPVSFNEDNLPIELAADNIKKVGWQKQTSEIFGDYFTHEFCFFPLRKSGKYYVFFNWDEHISTLQHLTRVKYLHELEQATAVLKNE
jgi:hypothetical protein